MDVLLGKQMPVVSVLPSYHRQFPDHRVAGKITI